MWIPCCCTMALVVIGAGQTVTATPMEERQITSGPICHSLDDNDNFSPCGRYLCYDMRDTVGPGIENSQGIGRVEIATGTEIALYAPQPTVIGKEAAPGAGAVSYHPIKDEVVFIHGPLVSEVPARGYYAKTNRRAARVPGDGSGVLSWVDFRDVETSRPTMPGAHRGGTHRHEYSLDGNRIGFTYDDHLLTQYDRTIGMLVPHPKAPGDASHWFVVLVPVAEKGKSRPGEIEKASADSWIGRQGLMRGFIGKVRENDGSFKESLFVVDIPAKVDVTTAHAGSKDQYPTPPEGVKVRRLTHAWAGGVVRGSADGQRIAYYAKAADGSTQVFLIASDGSDRDPNPTKRPVQLTQLPKGTGGSLRWHPSGTAVACFSDNGIVVTCAVPGPLFGKSVFLTPTGDKPERNAMVWAPDGKSFAYNKRVPTKAQDGSIFKTHNNNDCMQIFVIDYPDSDGDGITDALDS